MSNNLKQKTGVNLSTKLNHNRIPTIKVHRDEAYSKRLQYLQTRKAQSLSGNPDSLGVIGHIPNGQICMEKNKNLTKKPEMNTLDSTSSGFNRNDSLKCLSDNKTLFKLKSELLEFKTKTEKMQNEINVKNY
jgi:hypothetical protein